LAFHLCFRNPFTSSNGFFNIMSRLNICFFFHQFYFLKMEDIPQFHLQTTQSNGNPNFVISFNHIPKCIFVGLKMSVLAISWEVSLQDLSSWYCFYFDWTALTHYFFCYRSNDFLSRLKLLFILFALTLFFILQSVVLIHFVIKFSAQKSKII
jgi:hypothetical protein